MLFFTCSAGLVAGIFLCSPDSALPTPNIFSASGFALSNQSLLALQWANQFFSVNSGHNPQQDFLPRKLVFRSLQPCLVALFLGSSYEQWTEFSTFDCFCSLTYLFLALWVPWDKKLTIHTFVFLASSLPQNGVLINICFVGVGIFCFYSCSFCWKSSFYIY